MGGFEHDLKSKMLRGQPHPELLADNPILGFSLNEVSLTDLRKSLDEGQGFLPLRKATLLSNKANI